MNRLRCNVRWALLYILSLLPLKFLYGLSNVVAFILHYIVRYRYTTIFINLARSFPELGYKELKDIAKEYYIYMCDIMFESVWAISASEKQLCNMVKVENRAVIEDISEKHNIVLTVMGHMGNWELIGSMFGVTKERGDDKFSNGKYVLAYKMAHTSVTELLMRKMRTHQFKKFNKEGGVVESNRIMRHIISNRKETILYTLIADQSPIYGKDKVMTKFLNQPTFMIAGPEYIATKLNIPVVYLNIDRIKRGEYRVKFTMIEEYPAKLLPSELTKKYASIMEEAIIQNKYNWLWSHRRWKRELTEEEREEYSKL